jgi:ABC-type nitrate/sulfonate/bicarbonate transport system permease component
MRASLRGVAIYLLGFASLFLIWHLAATFLLSSVLFPTPWKVVLKAIELAQDGTLWEQASASLARIASGFVGGSLIGIPVGLAIGSFPIVRRLLEPYTEFLRFIPATALITVAVIWFGIGEGSKIFLIIAGRGTGPGLLLRRPARHRALHPDRHAACHGQLVRHHRGRRARCRQQRVG